MKLNRIIAIVSAVLFLGTFSLVAQDAKKQPKKNEKQTAETSTADASGSYLQIYRSKEEALGLRERNRADIYRLKIMVNNFGTDEDKKSLQAILGDYKEGVKYFYKQQFINSSNTLRKNQKDIANIYFKVSGQYRQKTTSLLTKCADALVETELGHSVEPGRESDNHARLVERNRYKLHVAYSQLVQADQFDESKRFGIAISHYRVAKFHGIQILLNLAKNEDERKKIVDEYAVDLLDNENRSADKS